MRTALALALVPSALSMMACGGDDDSDEEQIRSVAATYLLATAESDGDALCSASSETHVAQIELFARSSGDDVDCEEAVGERGLGFDDAIEALKEGANRIDEAEVLIEGEHALIRIEVDDDQQPPFSAPSILFAVEEDGEWKIVDPGI